MIVLYVLTGSETDVREQLIQFNPILPMEVPYMRINRVWTRVPHVLMPGYLFLDTDIDDHEYHRIKDAPGVIKVLNHRTPLPQEEAEMIRGMKDVMLEPHEIDAAGNVVKGFFQTENLKAVHKRQRRAVFEIRLMNKKTKVTVSATFLQ